MSVSPPSIQFSPSLNRKQEVSNRPTEMGVDGPHSSMRRCWLAGSSVSPPNFRPLYLCDAGGVPRACLMSAPESLDRRSSSGCAEGQLGNNKKKERVVGGR